MSALLTDTTERALSFPLRNESADAPEGAKARAANYSNSVGLCYEADHVFDCILVRGRTESEVMPLEESRRIVAVLDEVRRQLGVVFPADV